jgi:hypothetical protein
MTRLAIRFLALPAMLAIGAANASFAGPIEDWLFPRAATTCAPLATDPCGTVVTNLPVAGAVASPYAAPFAASPAATAPGPFRTAWVQIPLTVYKPVATIDPATGATVSTMQACTTHRWQLRRVPVGLTRPAWNASQPSSAGIPISAPVNSPAFAPVWQQGVPSAIAQPGCASCQSSGAVMYAPQSPNAMAPYAAPPASVPGFQTPPPTGSWAPPEQNGQPYTPSLTPVPSNGLQQGAGGGSPTPADMAPSLLKPSENPIQRPGNTPANRTPDGQADRATTDAEYPTITPSLRPLADPDAYAPQSPPPAANLAPVGIVPVNPQPTSLLGPGSQGAPNASQPQPSHSLQGPSPQGPSLEAPLLLNPSDRSA